MRRTVGLIMTATLATTLASCDRAAEELAERAAEQVTGADIEVDDDGGEITIQTDEGTFETGTGRVPDTFPSGIPLVQGGELVNGTSMDSEDGLFWQVNWQFDSGQPFDVLEDQVAVLEDAGFTRSEDGSFTMGDGSEGMGGTMLVNGTYQVNVTVLGEQDDFILGYQVFEQEQG